jgi:hypothetical protein
MKYDVYGVGNALVDIQAQVTDAALERLRFPKGIMSLVDEETQRLVLAALDGVPVSQCAGGSAANTIIGVADFGGNAAYAGKVADDALGEFCLADMRRMGVTIEVPPGEGHTGTCVVLITEDAQRTMLTSLGVSATLGPDDIDEDEIRQSKYVYIEGYLFTGASTRAAPPRGGRRGGPGRGRAPPPSTICCTCSTRSSPISGAQVSYTDWVCSWNWASSSSESTVISIPSSSRRSRDHSWYSRLMMRW